MRRFLLPLLLFGLLAGCSAPDGSQYGTPWSLNADAAPSIEDTTTDTGVDTAPDTAPDTGPDGGDCPDPDDPDVEYTERNPDRCGAALRCQNPGKRPFYSECGCGCITIAECPDELMERDGTCNEECSELDPDCAECPDPDDPNIEYAGNSYQDPKACRLLDFACPDKWTHFAQARCGCGCKKETSSCPDPDDPNIEYVSQDPQECDDILVGCSPDKEAFDNNCGCGCRADDDGECSAQDARGEGRCDAVIGVKFDGDRCHSISGCGCEGSDCDELYDSQWACAADNETCIESDPCRPHPQTRENGAGGGGGDDDGADDEPPCRIRYGWNGRDCAAFCHDPCDSSLCYGLYEDESNCETAHRHCERR